MNNFVAHLFSSKPLSSLDSCAICLTDRCFGTQCNQFSRMEFKAKPLRLKHMAAHFRFLDQELFRRLSREVSGTMFVQTYSRCFVGSRAAQEVGIYPYIGGAATKHIACAVTGSRHVHDIQRCLFLMRHLRSYGQVSGPPGLAA